MTTAAEALTNIRYSLEMNNTAQLSSNDYETVQLRTLMNDVGKELMARVEWSKLYKELVIPGNVTEYALPDDFHRMPETGAVRLNKAGFENVLSTVSPELWEFLTKTPSEEYYYRLRDGKILFNKELDSDGAIMPYVSKYWVENADQITQDGNILLISSRLLEIGTVARWRRQKEMPYQDQQSEYEATLINEINADRGDR